MTGDPLRPETYADVDAKIVAALERLAHVVHKALWNAAWRRKLSATQAQVLLYLASPPGRNVSITELARRFELKHSTLSDTIRVLVQKGLVTRRVDETDARAVRLRLTPRGRAVARSLALWSDTITQQIAALTPAAKSQFLATLLDIIGQLQRAGLISVARTCTTCLFFERNRYADPNAPHHCRLLNQPLLLVELRVDCPDHQLASAVRRADNSS